PPLRRALPSPGEGWRVQRITHNPAETAMDRTKQPPFPDSAGTGRVFTSPCCTAPVREFLVDRTPWLASSVAGHAKSTPWRSRIEVPDACAAAGIPPELVRRRPRQDTDRRFREH